MRSGSTWGDWDLRGRPTGKREVPPEALAKLRDPRIKADEEAIRKSLERNWRAEHILALKQRLSLHRSHGDLIDECDKEIEKLVAAFEPRVDLDEKPMPEDRKQKRRKRKKKSGSPDFDMRAEAYKLFGVDLTQIPGLMTLVFTLFSEVGRDMSKWPAAVPFTGDLNEMAAWLVSCGIATAAMESTGAYWIPVYAAVERHGIKPCLANPRNMKNVPGKRTDFHECQWIQHLHSLGLLHAAFRPDSQACAVRSLMRHRSDLVMMASEHIQHMRKAYPDERPACNLGSRRFDRAGGSGRHRGRRARFGSAG